MKDTRFMMAGTAVLALMLIAVGTSRLIYPFDLGYYEALSWTPARHLLDGFSPYGFALTPPYSMTPYGIVYYAAIAVGVGLFGEQLWWGRLVSIVATGVCAWTVFRIAARLGGGRAGSWFAVLVFLAMFPVQVWAGVMRSDLIGLVFVLAAVLLIFPIEDEEPRMWTLIAAALMCVLAFFTKQTYMLAPAFCFLRLLQIRSWKSSAVFAGVFWISAIFGILALNLTSSGGYIWQHFTHGSRLPHSFAQSIENLLPLAVQPSFIVFVLFAAVAAAIAVRSPKGSPRQSLSSPIPLLWAYLAISWLWAFVGIGRAGGSSNYFLEATALMAMIAGAMFESIRAAGMRRLLAALAALMFLGGAFQMVRAFRGEYYRWESYGYYREVVRTASGYVRPGGTCISVYVELAVRSGCRYHFDDFWEYTGGWSPELTAIFNAEVAAGRYDVVIWNTDRFDEEYPNYRPVQVPHPMPERFRSVHVYVRNDAPR